jgi:hypothetical protein
MDLANAVSIISKKTEANNKSAKCINFDYMQSANHGVVAKNTTTV